MSSLHHHQVKVAAFAVSSFALNFHRAGRKPFNPILGETYECVREDKGFKFIAEQVRQLRFVMPTLCAFVRSPSFSLISPFSLIPLSSSFSGQPPSPHCCLPLYISKLYPVARLVGASLLGNWQIMYCAFQTLGSRASFGANRWKSFLLVSQTLHCQSDESVLVMGCVVILIFLVCV